MRRVPVNLTPQQAEFILLLLAVVVVALVAGVLLEVLVGGGAGLWLRVTGHPPPKKSYYRMRLDQLDEELGDKPPKPR